MNKLITYTLVNCKVKQLRGRGLDGESFTEYIKMVVQGINDKKVPKIETMWQQISKIRVEKSKAILLKLSETAKEQLF